MRTVNRADANRTYDVASRTKVLRNAPQTTAANTPQPPMMRKYAMPRRNEKQAGSGINCQDDRQPRLKALDIPSRYKTPIRPSFMSKSLLRCATALAIVRVKRRTSNNIGGIAIYCDPHT